MRNRPYEVPGGNYEYSESSPEPLAFTFAEAANDRVGLPEGFGALSVSIAGESFQVYAEGIADLDQLGESVTKLNAASHWAKRADVPQDLVPLRLSDETHSSLNLFMTRSDLDRVAAKFKEQS